MLLRFNDFEVCTASAPGKVILFGEHAVVYGMTAIAASISDLRIFVKISPNPLSDISVILHDIRTEEAESFTHSISFELLRTFVSENQTGNPLIATNPDDWLISLLRVPFKNLPAAASQCLMSITYLVQRILPELTLTKPDTGLFIDVRSEGLPIGAGLGSSAAFSVALAGSLLRLRSYVCKVSHSDNQGRAEGVAGGIGITPSHELLASINAWAYASEVVIHGTPSGLDNTTSCYGGAVKFKKGEDSFQRLIEFPQIRILLTNTKVPRSTKNLVAAVKALRDHLPGVVDPIIQSIEEISLAFLRLLERQRELQNGCDVASSETVNIADELAALMNINHDLLCALGVGHPSLTAVRETSTSCGGRACKLTGAGGGGCAVTLLGLEASSALSSEQRSSETLLIEKLRLQGFEAFESRLGGEGVLFH